MKASGLVDELNEAEDNCRESQGTQIASFQHEGGSFQIEHIPGKPSGDQVSAYLDVEPSLRAR